MSVFYGYILMFLASLTLLIGYFSICQILLCVRFGTASKMWPTVEGVVIHSPLADAPLPDHQIERKQPIEYEYSVDGKPYQSDRVSFNHHLLSSTFRSRKERVVKGYAVGTKVRVFYDPNDPINSTLVNGYHLTGITSNLMTGAGGIIGGSMLFIQGVNAW